MQWLRNLLDRKRKPSGPPEGGYPQPGAGEFDSVAPYYDELMRRIPYKVWMDYIERIMRKYSLEPRLMLDLCCGTGRAGEEMLQRGYNCVGADLSEPMVRQCRDRDPVLPAAVMDAARLAFKKRRFDLIFSVFDSLNYILDPDDLQRCFCDVFALLKNKGLFTFDLNTVRALNSGLFNQNNLGTNDRLLYSWRAHWDQETRICTVKMWYKWRGEDTHHEFHETHCERAYSDAEVKQMLQNAGFTGIASYDGYTFNPLTSASNRASYVAKKERPDNDS